jgi:PhnB protein
MKAKSYVPAGYHTATPYLVIAGAARALQFYAQAFGAAEVMRLDMPDGRVAHAEIQIGDSRIMLADEFPEWDARGPKTIGGSSVSLMLYVPDCDAVFNQAVAAGATPTMPVADQFYGDRCGRVEDPFGHKWMIATHKKELSPEEIKARMAQAMGG